AERGDRGVPAATAPNEAVHDRTGAVDVALLVPAPVQLSEVASGDRGEARCRDIEEAVEVHLQRAVHDSSEHERRRGTHERLVQRVGRGETMVNDVPVTMVVLHVETDDAQRRREREGATELFG